MRFQQHEHRHRSQHQCKGQHPHRKAAHAVVVERNDMRKHQHHRKFGDLAGLQCAQARQHQPALAALYSGMNSTAVSNTIESASSGHASLW